MWALGSQNQLLGYISVMLVMATVSIAQIELEQSFVTSPSMKQRHLLGRSTTQKC